MAGVRLLFTRGLQTAFILGCFTVLFAGSVQAELLSVDKTAFSPDSVRLGMGPFVVRLIGEAGGPDLGGSLADWGIRLTNRDGVGPRAKAWLPLPPIPVLPAWNIVAEAVAETQSTDSALIVSSTRPLQRIGLHLANDLYSGSGETVTVRITAHGFSGQEIGRMETALGPGGPWIGVEAQDGTPIAVLVIDYVGEEPEKLAGLWLDYVDRPEFRTYLAQVGDGVLPSGESFTSSFVVTNLSNSTAEGRIEFFDDSGTRLPTEIAPGVWEDQIELAIPARESQRWTTVGSTSSVRSGWAQIISSTPVAATVRYTNFDEEGRVIAEAGIAASRAETYALAAFRRKPVGSGVVGGGKPDLDVYSTALAIANPWDEPVKLELIVAAAPWQTVTRELPPRGHFAEFVEELFPEMKDEGEETEGTIRIYATHPVAVTLLHTREGRAHASLPAVGRLE